MNQLTENELLIIFDYLDNKSMWNAMRTCKEWAQVFGSSSKLLRKFNLKISPSNVKTVIPEISKLGISFKNVTILQLNSCKSLLGKSKILQQFKNSIENLELKNTDIKNPKHLFFFSGFSSLKDLKLEKFNIEEFDGSKVFDFPVVNSLSFEKCNGNVYKIFKNQNSIEKVTIIDREWSPTGYYFQDFNEMAVTQPNLNHLVLDGTATSLYFNLNDFPFKIKKLHAYLMTFYWMESDPRTRFLESQKGYLKELTLEKLPYDYDGGSVLKYIIEEMKLEIFYYGKIPLILNGSKQNVEEFQAREVQITSAFEMFRQFPSIKSFNLFLTKTGLIDHEVHNLLQPTTTLFRYLQTLDILDHSFHEDNFFLFRGLYKNCRNISKLIIMTDNERLNEVLQECLPFMTQLKEIKLVTRPAHAVECFETLLNFVLDLKKLVVNKDQISMAKEIFVSDEVEVVGIDEYPKQDD